MNNYYLTLVLKADLEEKGRKTLLNSITKKFTGSDGKIEKEDMWATMDLAYPIHGQTKGFVAHYEISADPKDAKTLDKSLLVEEDILRYLLVRK